MLCGRLWSGLFDKTLKNISRYKFETIHNYGVLRKELRQIEQDLDIHKSFSSVSLPVSQNQISSSSTKPNGSPGVTVEPVSQFMSSVENKLLQQLQEMTNEMKLLNSRVSTVEKELQSLKKSRSFQGGYQERNRWGDKGKEKGPSDVSSKKSDNDKTDKADKPKSTEKPLNEK